MNLSTQPYKGSRDFYPEDKRLQKYMFGKISQVVESFGYQEYDAPILEPFEIYAAKSGEEIVNEQLYSFEDKGGRKVAIRPEMTPSVSRMVAARRQELSYPLRLYSTPNLWRYERPQRGRLREHWQLNVDLFGVEGLEADAEIIQVADAALKIFGAAPEMYEIHINSRKYLNELLDRLELTEEQKRGLLKLLDRQAKVEPRDFVEALNQLVGEQKAARLIVFLKKDEYPERIEKLLKLLGGAGVKNAKFNTSIVRGLEYYTDIVFEIFDTNPDNNRSMAGGGRYDGLVGQFGVDPIPTVGFAMGDVTLQNFLQAHKLLPDLSVEADAVAILIGDVYEAAQSALTQLRTKSIRVAVDSTGRKLDAQIRSAVKSGVRYAIFIGEKELKNDKFKLKDLETGDERELAIPQIASTLAVRHET